MPHCVIISFRFGDTDGVSVVARHWMRSLETLGFRCTTVAGEGTADVIVPGLGLHADAALDRAALEGALASADLVVVENLLSIPLNLPASRAVAGALAGRPAILHHHDPPWQREHFAHVTELPPSDPAWRHVTINVLTERQMHHRGIEATTIYNGFDTKVQVGDRASTRTALGVGADELLAVHPVRAIPRKDVATAVSIAEELGATYWLTGPAEDGYADDLDQILDGATTRVLHRSAARADIYAAADLVLFPSLWEGFGNPPIEAALYRRPVVVGEYPVSYEFRELGFSWFEPGNVGQIADFLANPDPRSLEHNRRLAVEHFSTSSVTESLRALLDDAGWLP